jgi:hypothetical protein
MTGFNVEPETFPPAAGQLRDAGSRLQAAWEPVKGVTQGVHFGSGTDMVSPLIQTSLAAAVEIVESCVTSSMKSLSGYADGLESMGYTYTETEQQTSALFRAE